MGFWRGLLPAGMLVVCLVWAPAALAADSPEIEVLSNRADLISAGDALVAVKLPDGVDPGAVEVTVGDRDVSDAFAVRENGRFEGLITDLGEGDNVVTAKLPDGSPLWNFVKAQISIWIQMVLVIAIAVTGSTLLNGPVAMLFTVGFITLGFFRQFFFDVATGKQIGGGPVESLVRAVTQRNMMTEIEDSFGTRLMHACDMVLKALMQGLAHVLPDFRSFSTIDYVAYGFNIPANQLAQDLTVGLAYVAGMCVVGYFLLRTREVAK